MKIVELRDPKWIETPRGPGWAEFLVHHGVEASLTWIVFGTDGQIWEEPNENVRACKNYTAYRPNPEKPAKLDATKI